MKKSFWKMISLLIMVTLLFFCLSPLTALAAGKGNGGNAAGSGDCLQNRDRVQDRDCQLSTADSLKDCLHKHCRENDCTNCDCTCRDCTGDQTRLRIHKTDVDTAIKDYIDLKILCKDNDNLLPSLEKARLRLEEMLRQMKAEMVQIRQRLEDAEDRPGYRVQLLYRYRLMEKWVEEIEEVI